MTKDEIRIHHKQLRNSISPEEHIRLDEAICTRILQSAAYQTSDAIFTFVSFRSEVDTKKIILQALKDEKQVYVPRVEKHGMEFYRIQSLEELIPNPMGIPEPQQETAACYKPIQERIVAESTQIAQNTQLPLIQTDEICRRLMLLPGLAFDRAGNRIGYGAGYYDRYLATYGEGHFYKIALAYDFQVMDQITSEEYDIKADVIMTPTQTIHCMEAAYVSI